MPKAWHVDRGNRGRLYPARRYLARSGERVWRAPVESDWNNACRTPRVHRLDVALSTPAARCCGRSARATCTRVKSKLMKKPIPTFKTDSEAEEFVANADLSDYDLSGGQIVRFEMRPKDKAVSLRLPERLLDAVRGAAKRQGVPYQRFIRMAIESALVKADRK